MQKYSQTERYSRIMLYMTFHAARFLGIIHGSIDRKEQTVKRLRKRNKIVSRILRVILVMTYWGVLPNMFNKVTSTPKSYINIFATMQTASVAIFAVISFIVQSGKEVHVIKILNRYFRLRQNIVRITGKAEIFSRKFLILLFLKTLTTMLGLFNEIPELVEVKGLLWISALIGVYMWMGSMFVLDACFLGFLVIAAMYGHIGEYISEMICIMHHKVSIVEQNGAGAKKLSHYRRMKLLCEYADIMDELSGLYAQLYALTKKFQKIFQWQILYYVYYNFVVILLLLHQCIWQYIEVSFVDLIALCMVTVKVGNLALLAMCAHYTVQQSQLPGLLCLDVVCTDIDERWDKSVQAFLSRRKFENLEIKILGIFQLNNEFILLLLSGIISYLFILIQFGITGGFRESDLVKNL